MAAKKNKPTPAGKDIRKVSVTAEYKKGYLAGVKRGAATAKTSSYFQDYPVAKTAARRGETLGLKIGTMAGRSRRSPRKQGD